MNVEKKGLEKALARSEKALAKAEAQIAKQTEKLGTREQAIPRREQTIAERHASKTEAATNSLRRSVARLAQDGYGVRLPAEDAQALAGRILAANDNEVEATLRSVTEDMVNRAVELRRLQPPELPGIGKPVPAAEQRARAQYHTEQMRKGITALAREVGYVMPREEAAALAARLSGMSEQDAMATLDELLLRPRTILMDSVETLHVSPEPTPARSAAPRELPGATPRMSEFGGAVKDTFVFPIRDAAGGKVGEIEYINGTTHDPDAPAITIRAAGIHDDSARGQGLGTAAYREIIDWAHAQDKTVYSSGSTNDLSDAVYERLRKQGYDVRRFKNGAGETFEIPPPAKPVGAATKQYVVDQSIPRLPGTGNAKAPAPRYDHGDLLEAQQVYREAVWRTQQPESNASHERFAANAKAKLDDIERALTPATSSEALRDELTPARIEEMRTDPDMHETVARDLDKLMLERPDIEVPTGVTVDAEGRTVPTTRKVEDVVAEADARLEAAKEIAACTGPYPSEAAQ
jgi:GNAT superfamily N-acetyltransferase